MGASQANGVGIFADNAGDDGYDSKQGMPVAHLVEGRRAGGIGLFLDAGGKDRYSKYGSDNSVWGHNRWEVGVDQERGGVSGINLPHRPDPLPANRSVKIQRAKEQAHLRSMLALSRSEPLLLRVEGMLSVASHWGFEREIPKDAQENLLAMPPSRSVPAMVELIPTPDVMALRFMRRFFAVHAFYAVPELIKKANGPDPMVRGRALHYLGGLKDTRALKTCGEALSDRSWRVRSAAARALGEMLNHDRLSHLVPMRAAFILARRQKDSNPIVHYLSDRDRTAAVISVLVRTLSLRYDEYVRYERMALGREGTSKDLAVRVYGRLGKVLPVLDQWIKDIQGSAAIAQRLMACLKDPDPAVRASGAYALGQIRYRKALPELTALLKDPALWVRDGTALSLRLFGDDCIDVLGRAMAWEGASFRIIAIDLLGRVNSRRARELINRYGRDRDPNVRRSANQALSSQRAGP
jgi:HEAT repeat protein